MEKTLTSLSRDSKNSERHGSFSEHSRKSRTSGEIALSIYRREHDESEHKSKQLFTISEESKIPPPNVQIVQTVSRTKAEAQRNISLRKAGHLETKKKGLLEDRDEHLIRLEDLCKRLSTDAKNGLTESQRLSHLEKWGENTLTPPPSPFWFFDLLGHMTGFFSLLLWGASLLCFIAWAINPAALDNLYLGVVLATVVFFTGLFSYYQDSKSNAVMAGFQNFLPEKCIVIRDGRDQEVLASELVPGDLVKITSGMKIPADMRVVTATMMKVNNSSLTGENMAQLRSPISEREGTLLLEARNTCFYGTLCVGGSGTGIVFATGDDTTIGTIAKIASDASNRVDAETPINREIGHFIKIISAVAITIGIIFLGIGFGIGIPPLDNIVFAIGIIVANVPEGLLATVTVALTLTAQRMARKKVLVKNLESVETLGSTTVIASDKTGTLTQNIMTVQHLWFNGTIHDAITLQESDSNLENATFDHIRACLALCTTATFKDDQEEKENIPFQNRSVSGDASEAAMIKFIEPILRNRGESIIEVRHINPAVYKLPFDSANKFMVHICKMQGENENKSIGHMLWMKGAPEKIWKRCTTVMLDGKERPKEKMHAEYEKGLFTLMNNGERVLGLCMKLLDTGNPEGHNFQWDGKNDKDATFDTSGFIFIGLIALMDPPRVAVPEAVKSCQKAGIQVIMVTGDHQDTAEAIAKMVGIIKDPTRRDIAAREGVPIDSIPIEHPDIGAKVICGNDLGGMTDQDLDLLLDCEQLVFARTSPADKLTIVKALQEKKFKRFKDGRAPVSVSNVVAVTGDGVNDSPALSQADIGVAMGVVGTDVAKNAADMILLNDNFASIVDGVEEGRLIFDNLKKSISYSLTSNIPELTPFLVFVVLQVPLPLTTILILLIDLGTDLLPAISLAYETKEADIMNKPPRNANVDRLVSRKLLSFSYLQIGIIQAVAGFCTYFIVLNDYGFAPRDLLFASQLFVDFANDNASGTYFPEPNDTIRATRLVVGDNEINLSECIIKDPQVCHKPDEALLHAQTAFFTAIMVVQGADILACRTRRLSIFQQGMRNKVLNFAIFQAVVIGCILAYVPPINAIGTRPIRLVHWFPPMPFFIVLLTYDEVRKFLIRLGQRAGLGNRKNIFEEYTYF